ncbi:MAG TPA: NUDIX hydrolase [Thioalkalivibrio sp.]|nr:NUDIX hydrolase [Thioalkalivibrio sp.]
MSYCYDYPRPAVTTDVVVFTIREETLQLLLIKRAAAPYQGCWALPGGFVEPDESLEQAAARELEEETGVAGVYLEQLYTYGAPDRDPRDRIISVAYYALVPSDRLQLRAASDAEDVRWFGFDALPALAFDHDHIARMAHERLAAKLDYSTIALQFMPERFTLGELQEVYETILRAPQDKRNFRKRILALEAIEATGERRRNGAHRPAMLYRVRDPQRVAIIK